MKLCSKIEKKEYLFCSSNNNAYEKNKITILSSPCCRQHRGPCIDNVLTCRGHRHISTNNDATTCTHASVLQDNPPVIRPTHVLRLMRRLI